MNDERLSWLTEDFIDYIDEIQKSYNQENVMGFTKETHEALKITSQATAACVKYLLQENFKFVLTRNLTSDDIEAFFGHIRHKGGYNDMMDVRSCLYAIDKERSPIGSHRF